MGACLNQLLENETKESLAVMAEKLIGEKLRLQVALNEARQTISHLSKSWDILKADCDERSGGAK